MKISLYDKVLNYKSGNTNHFNNLRILREQELTRLLGKGNIIRRFILYKEDGTEIQEVLDNGIIKIYSAETHKKITVFAPSPDRLIHLFESCGLEIPDNLVKQSELNERNGYSNIYKE